MYEGKSSIKSLHCIDPHQPNSTEQRTVPDMEPNIVTEVVVNLRTEHSIVK